MFLVNKLFMSYFYNSHCKYKFLFFEISQCVITLHTLWYTWLHKNPIFVVQAKKYCEIVHSTMYLDMLFFNISLSSCVNILHQTFQFLHICSVVLWSNGLYMSQVSEQGHVIILIIFHMRMDWHTVVLTPTLGLKLWNKKCDPHMIKYGTYKSLISITLIYKFHWSL
jgi:hypothetical protein